MQEPAPAPRPGAGLPLLRRFATREDWLSALVGAALAAMTLWLGGARAHTRIWPYLLLTLAAYLMLRGGQAGRPLGRSLGRWIWGPALAAGLASLWSVNPRVSYDVTLTWVAFAITAWLAAVAGRRGARPLVDWLMAALALPPLVTLPMLILSTAIPRTMTYDYKNAAGISMAALILLCWAYQVHLWHSGAPRRSPSAWWPTLLGLLASLFLWYSFSRLSLYLAFPGLLVGLWLIPARWRVRALVLGILLILAGGPLMQGAEAAKAALGGVWDVGEPAKPPELFDAGHMLFQTGDYSFVTRLELWTAAWRAFLARPWGWGPGTYADVYLQFQAPGSQIFSNSVHSLLFSSLFETGPLLLLALAGLAWGWLRIFWPAWRRVPEGERPLLGGAAAALAVLAAHGILDLTWEIPAILLTVAALGGLVAARLQSLSAAAAGPAAAHPAPGLVAPAPRSAALPLWVGLAVFVLVIRPYYAYNLLTAGLARIIDGQPEAAIPLLRQASLLDPLDPRVHSWLANAHFRQWQSTRDTRDLAEAEAQVARALRLSPRSPALHGQAARYRLAAGDVLGQLRILQAGLQYAPRDMTINATLGLADVEAGRAAAARRRLEALVADYDTLRYTYPARTMNEWWPRVRLTLALAFAGEGRLDQAVAQLQTLLQEYPDNAQARQLLDQLQAP